MPSHELPIITILRPLENDLLLAEALFFPEILRCGDDPQQVQESLRANIERLTGELPLQLIHQRHPAGEPETSVIEITLEPLNRETAWRAPVTLRLPYVRWDHGETTQIAYVPALHLEVVAPGSSAPETLAHLLTEQIQAALRRINARNSLGRLIWLQRNHTLELRRQTVSVNLPSPKQIAVRAASRDEEKKSALAEAATDLTKQKLPAAFELDATIEQLAECLVGRQPRSVLLVGKSGVGKTAALYELVRRRHQLQLGFTPFWATNGSRLIAGMSGFGQWQERCQRLWREAAQERAILYLGNLIELMEVGKHVGNTQGIAGFLRPYIARGDVLAIAECTPEQLTLIERNDARLLQAFQQLNVEEPSAERGRNILLSVALAERGDKHAAAADVELESIERTDQLHRRYASYSAYPGRPVRFLKNLLQDRRNAAPLTAEEVTAAFSRETGLPRVLLDEQATLDLDATRAWFSSRVIGQPDAVDLIVDLLATVKAGLTRPRKPIASLLFIGPTGVGKTEMAKSLAEFLFQDRGRMVRFDMSEYADPLSVHRLIGGNFGGDAGAEGLLTAKVREQPFAVVLLDEFEKAHPLFFDLLLQVLGEGRLTDAMGRVADFSNAVVIMTSNLGAESFQRGLVGFQQTAATRQAASKHFLQAVRNALRPEMFNRIDRIVPFAPLDEQTVEHITKRELDRLWRRDGIRYGHVQLKLSDGVAEHFARRGYDPRYGARPLKRIIERELLAPLAARLAARSSEESLAIDLQLEDGKLQMNAQPLREAGPNIDPTEHPIAESVRDCQTTRREAQQLQSSPTARTLRNDIYTLERLAQRQKRGKWLSPDDLTRLAELPQLMRAEEAILDFGAGITQLEHEALLALYSQRPIAIEALSQRIAAAATEWTELLLATYTLGFKTPDRITLIVYSENTKHLFELAQAYVATAESLQARIEAIEFTAPRTRTRQRGKDKEKEEDIALRREPIKSLAQYLASPRENVIGLAFGLSAPRAFPWFVSEAGVHRFVQDKTQVDCLVQTTEVRLNDYLPPAGIARHGALSNYELRRRYNYTQGKIKDTVLDRELLWNGDVNSATMRGWLEEALHKRARLLLQE